MATRAVYTFKDNDNTFHVYKHHDGYPSGAYEWISAALPLAWPLPRYEACEFATAFIAANKPRPDMTDKYPMQGGGVYLTGSHKEHGDLDYRYEISFNGVVLIIAAFENDVTWRKIFEGTLDAFKQFITKNEG